MRFAIVGSLCSSLGIACLLLAACTNNPARPSLAPRDAQIPVSVVEPAAPMPVAALSATGANAPQPVASPWDRLRSSFVMDSCDYNPAVTRWTRQFSQPSNQFAASLATAMPFLLLVLDQLEAHHLPGEFAFLPYLESTYTPLVSSGDRAAGIWQLMPDTAREVGLSITPDYDGRLDIYSSTITAIGLLQQYNEEFGDWRLADMAFNAGQYRMRQLVHEQPHAQWSAPSLGRLNVNPGTHDHLAKLLALACVVTTPQRYHVRLPEPQVDDALALLNLPAPVDLHLAARLSGIDDNRLRYLNPAFLRGRMPAEGPFHLLVPSSRRVHVEQTLGKLPQWMWRDWREVTLKQTETLDIFAMAEDIDPQALAAINTIDASLELAPGTHLLLPGHVGGDAVLADAQPVQKAAPVPGILTVHAGDTLWAIAHRYNVHIDDLMRWNGLTHGTKLRLGQHLDLSAREEASR